MDPVVRRAVPADAAQLALLEGEARASLVGIRGGDAVLGELGPPLDWPSAIDAPRRLVLVGTIGAVVAGYLIADLPAAAGGVGVVQQVYVHPDAREVGFGDHLLAGAIDAVTAAGATAIESWALPGDRETKNLFERAGMTARKLIVSRRLG